MRVVTAVEQDELFVDVDILEYRRTDHRSLKLAFPDIAAPDIVLSITAGKLLLEATDYTGNQFAIKLEDLKEEI